MVRFTSGSYKFLASLQSKMVKLYGIGPGSLFSRGPTHHVLGYSTSDSRQLYNLMYPTATVPCLTRKRHVFENTIEAMGP
jgi:hypothetical protein